VKLHYFFIDFPLHTGEAEVANTEIVHQVRDVLKMKASEKIVLCDGRGLEAEAIIISLEKKKIEVEIGEIRRNVNEPDKKVILYCTILKRENFELAVQKAVEVGVTEIVPIISQRTVKTKLNEVRLKKIMREAAEQAERGILPILHSAMDLTTAFAHCKNNDFNLFFDPRGEKISAFAGMAYEKLGIFVGPEGGWTEDEIEAARMAGCQIACLGKTILRGETAAITAAHLAAWLF